MRWLNPKHTHAVRLSHCLSRMIPFSPLPPSIRHHSSITRPSTSPQKQPWIQIDDKLLQPFNLSSPSLIQPRLGRFQVTAFGLRIRAWVQWLACIGLSTGVCVHWFEYSGLRALVSCIGLRALVSYIGLRTTWLLYIGLRTTWLAHINLDCSLGAFGE